jgi:N-acetylglucosaminyldiphosphoundecaprenol N-acetyl-beta-D-mannosaminyltransferase
VVTLPHVAGTRSLSDFDRDVYCLHGIPIDAAEMDDVLRHVHAVANRKQRCFLSTPNLNFLMGCQRDVAFRNSLINSDLNIVDGLPLAWMARRLGIPVKRRVTGSGMFEALMAGSAQSARRLSVYFFGGREGAAEAACRNLNAGESGLTGCGAHYPGFGTVQELSDQATIDRINASNADFLVVALGARKGQDWIEHNRRRLTVPVISHLGAVVNFVAGTVDRAPAWVQRFGMEWLWRIKEEPALWSRYWHDGVGMLNLMTKRLLPYMAYLGIRRAVPFRLPDQASARLVETASGECRIAISGAVPDTVSAQMRAVLRETALLRTHVTVDLSDARHLSPAMFGLLLILRKHQAAAGCTLGFVGLSARMRQLFRWNGVDYLLTDKPHATEFDASGFTTVEATSL